MNDRSDMTAAEQESNASISPSAPVPPQENVFWLSDWLAAALVAVVTLALYSYTLMPNIGLQDSGELVTSAVLFGVPHPPGYPFWSLTGFIFSKLMPFGNYAWRMNLLSAIFGALSCALLTLLLASSSRWLLENSLPKDRRLRMRITFYGSAAAGLILGFSRTMWEQAVMSDHVRTQNSFILMLTFFCFYHWVVKPEGRGWLLAAVAVFTLGVTNHPTVLMTAPAFLVPVVLINPRFFWSYLIGFILLVITAMAGLTWFSEDPGMEMIAYRLAIMGIFVSGFIGFAHMSRFSLRAFLLGAVGAGFVWLEAGLRIGGWFSVQTFSGLWLFLLTAMAAGFVASSILEWKFALAMVLAGWCGLMMFAKMPIASSTNPPMNWSYTRVNSGLYQSITRGQYPNNLPSMIKKWVGGAVGFKDSETAQNQESLTAKIEYIGNLFKTLKMYGRSLEENFTLPMCLLIFPLVLYMDGLDSRRRAWMIFLVVSFALLGFTLSIVDTPAQLDRTSWQAIIPFHILSHCMMVLAIGYGLICGLLYLLERFEEIPQWLLAGTLFLALMPLQINAAISSRRGHWFGWQYGVDMLRPLEKGAIVYGGTDPGRFVPTYMIFCESQQPKQFKHEPDFDRSDLYIITQNALADLSYAKYIRDQYDDRFRPKKFTPFEKWLNRDKQYPKQGLHLLDDEEFGKCMADFARQRQEKHADMNLDVMGIFEINGIIARAIFEQNKKDHTFYVEESLPIDWMYPYMVPAGLLLRLNPEPISKLSPQVVEQDRKFWDDYTARLQADPCFQDSLDAQRSFSKLRNSFGNMYRARGMTQEALYAYKQALEISPDNSEVVQNYFLLLMSGKQYDLAEAALHRAIEIDPHNDAFRKMLAAVQEQSDLDKALAELREQIVQSPKDYSLRDQELQILYRKQDLEGMEKALNELVLFPELPHETFVEYVKFLSGMNRMDTAIKLLNLRKKIDPTNGDLLYNAAALEAYKGNTKDALKTFSEAVKFGGPQIIDTARTDTRFGSLLTNAEFIKLMHSTNR